MTRNREQDVIDAIDALVDEQMAGGEHAHRQRAQAAGTGDRCALCGGAWHGEPWTGVDREHLGRYDQHDHGRVYGCPGANATGPQRIRWRHEDRGARWLAQHGFPTGGSRFVDQTASVAWTVDMVNAMRPPVPPWQLRLYEGIVRRHSQEIQLPNAPAINPGSWGLQPYFLVDDDGHRRDPQPSPWAYSGPELREGARFAVQLADGSLVTGTIGELVAWLDLNFGDIQEFSNRALIAADPDPTAP